MTAPFNLENSIIITPGLQGPPGPVSASVPDSTSLTAVTVAGLMIGSIAEVQSRSSYWSYQPGEAFVDDGYHIASSGTGSWVYAGPSNSAGNIRLTSWKIDPVNGNNDNDGQILPIKSIEETVRRVGGRFPSYPVGQSLAFYLLSSMSASELPIDFEPQMNGGNMSLVGTIVAVGDNFTAGTLTPKSRTAGASPMSVANFPGAAAAPMLVYNVTRDSYSTIDRMSGSTAFLCQPYKSAGLTTIQFPIQGGVGTMLEDDTWTTGDTLRLYSCPNVLLARFQTRASGGNLSPTQKSMTWVQFIHVLDPNPIAASLGRSVTFIQGDQNSCHSCCSFDTVVLANPVSTSFGIDGYSVQLMVNCAFDAGGFFRDRSLLGGTFNPSLLGVTEFMDGCVVDGDFILHGTGYVKGRYSNCGYGLIASDGTLNVINGGTLLIGAQFIPGGPLLYGSFLNVRGARSSFACSNYPAQVLVTTMLLESLTVGSYRTANSSTWNDNVTVSAANLASFGWLENSTTGARYC